MVSAYTCSNIYRVPKYLIMSSCLETKCTVLLPTRFINVHLFESQGEESQQTFQFMSLPLELRLKIYKYILPPRRHIIVSRTLYTGYFYNTLPLPPGTGYPFGRAPSSAPTAYKVLSQNQHCGFPSAAIYPAILRTSRQVRVEAEQVLYGGKQVKWDFGIHLAAATTFWKERSQFARDSVRTLRIAKEVPCIRDGERGLGVVDTRWKDFCSFVSKSLPNIQVLDLTIWSSSGSIAGFPAFLISTGETGEKQPNESLVNGLSCWLWTHKLLLLENLRELKVTTWDFESMLQLEEKNFDSWLPKRMLADSTVKARMIRVCGVKERSLIIPGAKS